MRNKLILLSLLTLPLSGMAATSVNVSVTGTLFMPMSCDLGAATKTIAFGDIYSERINGTEYKKDLGISMTCTNWNGFQSAKIRITGTGTTTNKLPIAGTAKGFQLALKRNNTAVNFGTDITIPAQGDLQLSLTPEKNTAAFVAGAFTAAATVVVTVT